MTVLAHTSVPTWPQVTATVDTNGAGEVVVDGQAHPIAESDLDRARDAVVAYVAEALVLTYGRSVRLDTYDPEGYVQLIVHGDGTAEEAVDAPTLTEAPAGSAPAVAEGSGDPDAGSSPGTREVDPAPAPPGAPVEERPTSSALQEAASTLPGPELERAEGTAPAAGATHVERPVPAADEAEIVAAAPPPAAAAVDPASVQPGAVDLHQVPDPHPAHTSVIPRYRDLDSAPHVGGPHLQPAAGSPTAGSDGASPPPSTRDGAGSGSRRSRRSNAQRTPWARSASATPPGAPGAVPDIAQRSAAPPAPPAPPASPSTALDPLALPAPPLTITEGTPGGKGGTPSAPSEQPTGTPGSTRAERQEGARDDKPVPTLDNLLATRPSKPAAPPQWGWRAAVHRASHGLINPAPSAGELAYRADVAKVQRRLSGTKTIVVVNPKGGAHKTTAALLLAATFGMHRGGSVLAWDNNETRGTLGWRAQPAQHTRTAVDLLHDLPRISAGRGLRVGDLDEYVRPQDTHLDVLASDEDAASAALIDGDAFSQLHATLSRFYRIMVVDTGNNMRASNWRAAVAAADQLVIVSTVREDTAQSAAWLADALRAGGHADLVRRAVTVLTAPTRSGDDRLGQRFEDHFARLTRAVISVPHDPGLVSGSPIDYAGLRPGSRRAWLQAAAAVAAGL